MMNVQEFIHENGVDALTEQFAITVKKYDNGYVKLNYSQVLSPKFHSICDEARGLTLQVFPDNTTEVVTRGFKRFYNFLEGNTKDFDFNDCTAYEKADGSISLISWSPVDDKWIISTRGMAYAEGNFSFSLTASGGTFFDWILKAMQFTDEQFQKCMSTFDMGNTYVMEYTSPCNRVVVPYTEDKMVLLAVIHNDSGEEVCCLDKVCKILQERGMNIRVPVQYSVVSGAHLVEIANSLPGLQEGFVVVNNKTRERVKIKNSQYVAVHYLKGGDGGAPSLSRFMEMVLKNEQAEAESYFPEFRPYIEPIEKALAQLLAEAQSVYESTKSIGSQKDFALAVKDTLVAPLMFRVRKDGTSVVNTFENLDINLQMKLLEKFLTKE